MIDIKLFRKRYHGQKSQANKRGIEWNFTFDSWLEWWGNDILNRGCSKGQLVMARNGDMGPYHPDNVFKTTCSENCRDGNKNKIVSEETKNKFKIWRKEQKFTDETRLKMSLARKGILKSDETRERMSIAQQKRFEME